MKRFGLTLIFACLVLATSAQAQADGVVLINPTGVVQGGQCHGQGFPIRLCAPGSYKLVGNITAPAGSDAIDVEADNVSIDLNGFSLNGPVTCTVTAGPSCSGGSSGTGVYSASDNTTLKNGSVTGFVNGITLVGHGSLVEEVHAKNNLKDGLHVWYGIVRRCTGIMSGYSGVYMKVGVIENSFFQYNYTGIFGTTIVVLGNSTVNNNNGLNVYQGSLYGGNSFTEDVFGDIFSLGGAVSQHNNVCGTAPC